MLVLTRKVGETILIGADIKITLVRIEDDQVRIGISAPKDVPVYRKELVEEVGIENIKAAEAARRGSEALAKLSKVKPTSAPKSDRHSKKSPKR